MGSSSGKRLSGRPFKSNFNVTERKQRERRPPGLDPGPPAKALTLLFQDPVGHLLVATAHHGFPLPPEPSKTQDWLSGSPKRQEPPRGPAPAEGYPPGEPGEALPAAHGWARLRAGRARLSDHATHAPQLGKRISSSEPVASRAGPSPRTHLPEEVGGEQQQEEEQQQRQQQPGEQWLGGARVWGACSREGPRQAPVGLAGTPPLAARPFHFSLSSWTPELLCKPGLWCPPNPKAPQTGSSAVAMDIEGWEMWLCQGPLVEDIGPHSHAVCMAGIGPAVHPTEPPVPAVRVEEGGVHDTASRLSRLSSWACPWRREAAWGL